MLKMLNRFDPNVIPVIDSFTDRAYIRDMDSMRPEKLLDDAIVRNKIDDYKLSMILKSEMSLYLRLVML